MLYGVYKIKKKFKEANDDILKHNWVTHKLREYIEPYYPKPEHFILIRFNTTCQRETKEFTLNCQKIFSKDHIFASSKN